MKEQTVNEELAGFKSVVLVENGLFKHGAEHSAPWLVVTGHGDRDVPNNTMMPVVCNAQCVWQTIRQQRWIDRPYNVVAYLAGSISEATRICAMLDELEYNTRRLGNKRSSSELLAVLV